ncbi:MAG: glycosyltransferase family 39 protein [Candidatus Eiseniibacteriota bacterium]
MWRKPLGRLAEAPGGTRSQSLWSLDTGRGVAAALGVYVLVAFALRLILFPAGSQDDSEQLLFSQTLAGGYNHAQPPLYTWLVYGAQHILGVTLASVLVVKYAAIGLLYFCLWRAARLVLDDTRLAAYAALAPLAMYYVAWDALINYSNTVLMAALCAATFWAVIALDRRASIGTYVGLGAALGIGFLSKYGFGVFTGALLIAALADPVLRRRLFDRRILISLALALVILSPHLWWVAQGARAIATALEGRLISTVHGGYWATVGHGLFKLANGIVSFPFPLYLLLPALFPAACRRLDWSEPDALRHKRLFERFALAGLAIMVIGVVGFGVAELRAHYLFVFLPMPICFFLRVRQARRMQADASARGMAWYPRVAATMAVLAFIGLGVKFAAEPQWCKRCYLHMPYAALAQQMRAAGFARGTLIAYFHRIQLAGNFRPYFPDSRILSTKYPYYRPPRLRSGPCMLIWDPAYSETMPEVLSKFAAEAAGIAPGTPYQVGAVEAPLLSGAGLTARLRYALVTGGACR